MYLLFKFIPHEHGPPLFLSCFLSLSLLLWIYLDPSCPCLSVGSRAAFMQTDRMQTTILIFHMYNFNYFLTNYILHRQCGKIALTSITEYDFLQHVIFHHSSYIRNYRKGISESIITTFILLMGSTLTFLSLYSRINIEKKGSVSCPLSTLTRDQKESSKLVRPASLPVRWVSKRCSINPLH